MDRANSEATARLAAVAAEALVTGRARPGSTRLRRASVALIFWGLVLVLTLGLRLVGAAERGIWQDEGLTLYQVRLPFRDIVENRIPVAHLITQNTVPPLYFLALAAWGHLVGTSLWALRLFGVGASLLSVVLLYRVGRWMDGPATARVAALLGALSPLYLWYAQELRMYAFLVAPATLSFGLLWRWHRRWHSGRGAGKLPLAYALTAAAMAWTHYLALLLVAAQGLWLALAVLRHRPKTLLATGSVLLLLVAPLVPFGLRRLMAGAERDFFFLPLPTIAGDLLHALSFGPPVFMSPFEQVRWLLPLSWLLLALGLWQAWRRGGWPLATLLGAGLALPVLLLYTLSYLKPLYQNARHLIFISPVFYLLWALGLRRLAEVRGWLPLLVVPLLAWGWGLSIARYMAPTVPLKNDVRPLFESIAAQAVAGDVVALNDPVLQHAFEYLAPGIPWTVVPPYGETDPTRMEPALAQLAQQYRRVWYVYGPADSTFDTWQTVYQWFERHFPRIGYEEFPGQTLVGVAYFDLQGPSVQPDPHPPALPADALFEQGVRYLGLFRAPDPVAAGQRGVVETLWTVDAQPSEDWQVVTRLVDGTGRGWHQEQSLPFAGLHMTSRWLPGQFVRLPLFFTVAATLPPGPYRLELFFLNPQGEPRYPVGSNGPLAVGSLDVTRPVTPTAVAGPQVGESLRVQVAALPPTLAPAARLPLTLHVERASPGALPQSWTLRAEDEAGEVWTTTMPLDDGLPQAADGQPLFPPATWQEGDTVTLRYEVPLPPTLEGSLRFSLMASDGAQPLAFRDGWGLRRRATLPLGALRIPPRERRTVAPPVAHEVAVAWGGTARLRGYTTEPEAPTAGPPIALRLAWEALAPTERPYKVFLHVVDVQGAFVAGADALFEVPTVAWGAGEWVFSDHRLAGLPAGEYTLLIGLYDETSGERLPVAAPNNALPLGTLRVAP